MNCICGCKETNNQKIIIGTVTDSQGKNQSSDFQVVECKKCGIVRQTNIKLNSEKKYKTFYENDYPPLKKSYTIKDYKSDRELAKKKCDGYVLNPLSRLLDVGSGSGAFVDECREREIEAYGCEIGKYHYSKCEDHIYYKRLEDIYFPTDYFDMVTCYDVTEHVLNPVTFISEMFRILKQEGICIIEIPRFHHKSGKHHWKDIEHIWYFTTEQFKKILERIGFVITEIKHPIESKTVFHCMKPVQIRPTILYPPGIGDCYWSIVKTQAFLKREGLGIPDIRIVQPREKKYQGHKRSFPFIQMFPFLNSTGINFDGGSPRKRVIWREAYAQRGRTIFKNVMGHDYFISYNGHLRFGESLDEIDSDLECNWFPPMFTSLEQEHYRKHCIKQYGKYIIFYFAFQGTYINWIKQFSINNTIKLIKRITEETELTPVFIGAIWDKENQKLNHVKASVPGCIDLVGETTLSQLFGLIRGSEMVVGYPSGVTIMATVLKRKTLIIWNNYYNKGFFWNACPPVTKNKTYFIANTKAITVDSLSKRVSNILTHEEHIYKSATIAKPKKVSVTIMCVLKSGGDFTVDYVKRLRNMIKRNTTLSYKFLCLTDINIDPAICDTVRLINNQKGWWSKIELFRPKLTDTERILYFDLDSVIVSNINDVLSLNDDFIALQPWNKQNRKRGMYASGMMGWKNNGAYSFLYSLFKEKHKTIFTGDQQYISNKLRRKKVKVSFFQDQVNGIHSYKRECRQDLPPGAKIICFHGRPRPHETKNHWMNEHWR